MDASSARKVIETNLKVLDGLGVKTLACDNCPECGLITFSDAEFSSYVCGLCGYGPWSSDG
jgi:ribosomal protein S27AE